MDPGAWSALQDLETLRRRWEQAIYALGDAYDYLDRGRPSDKERRRTWKWVEMQRQEIASLREQLESRVAELRTQQPEVIRQWVTLHRAVYREVYERYVAAPPTAVPEPQVAKYIANEALEKWAAVERGEQNAVEHSRYLMMENQDLVKKHFGF